MKIYCIKIDALPFRPEVLAIAKTTSGTLLRQVSGAYTLASLIQMFTGRVSSDFESQGVGYCLWGDKRDENGFANWSWMENYIQFYLLKKGFYFINRNYDIIMNKVLGFGRFSEFNRSLLPEDNLDGKSHSYLITHNPEQVKSRDREFAWIDKAQAAKGDFFYNINYGHFHAAVHPNANREKAQQRIAWENVLELINHYDFSESEALFWIFTDHGSWRNPFCDAYPYPEHFYTWAVVRDNSKNPLVFPSKVISIQDFYSFIKYKFDTDIQLPDFSKERIYITEDGRQNIAHKYITTAIACRFEKWRNDFPLQMNYLMYHKPANRFVQRISELNDEQFTVKTKDIKQIDESLMDVLRSRFSWID